MASDLTTVAFIYMKKYADGAPADIAQRMHPLFGRITKKGGFVGTSFNYAIRYVNPQGVGGTFATTQTASANSKGKQLTALRFPKYGVITLNGEAMAAAPDKGAFLDLVTMETDGILEEMGDSFAFDLYRQGYGQRGQRSSASTNVITLSNPDDARNFKEGMTVIADDTATGLSPRTGSTTIASVDEDAGTITLTSAAAITGFADSDYLFRAGDPGTCMEGLELCTPLTAPVYLSDSFRGIDRGSDVKRLAGSRLADTSNTIEENIGRVAIKVSQIGKKVDECYLNPVNFWAVARRLNAKVEYDGGGGEAKFGFETISISTPAGTVRVVSDPDCPTDRGRLINSSAHHLRTLRGLPHIIEDDGRPSLRSTNADSIEARARGWVNYIQTDPGAFGVFSI
jgi:hypothetical protein